jgi:TonB family protein
MRPQAVYRPSPFPAARGSRTRVEVVVDALGRVESARLRTPSASYFDERALETVRAWRFEPARRGGRPVRSSVDVEIPPR